MWTGPRVPQERAYLIGGLGRENVFELAGLLFDFSFAVHGETVGEEPLGEAMAANNVGSPLSASGREFHDHGTVAGRDTVWFQGIVAGVDERLVIVRFRRMWGCRDQSQLNHFFYRD